MSDLEEKKLHVEDYNADNIQVLEGLEAVRKRPAMYIGDIGERGLHHLVYEVVDNSIDEALAGHCNHIEVTIYEDNSISVLDNGRGIPTDMHEKEHRSALEVVLTVLHAGGKFNKDSYKVSGGLHGVGVSCVNALSKHLRADVYRNGKHYVQEFAYGKPLYSVKEDGTTDYRGTKITFTPDDSIFNVSEYKYDILAGRLKELAFLNKKIRIQLTDRREKEDNGEYKSETFYSEEGLKDFIRFLDSGRTKIMETPIYIETEKTGVPIEVVMQYNDGWNENIHSYVNNINTIEGGTHLTGFRRALTNTLKRYASNNKMLDKLEKDKIEISGDDFRQGLTAIISVKVAEPQFEGQTKTKLGNSEIEGVVSQAVSDMLENYLEEHPRDAKEIVGKVSRCSANQPSAAAASPASFPTARRRWRKSANSTSWRVTPQAAPPSRAVTATSRPSSRCVVRF